MKVSVFPLLFLLYKRKVLRLSSASLVRDGLILCGSLAYMEAGEFYLSKYMWANVEEEVKTFGRRKQQEMALKYQNLATINRNELQADSDLLDH